MPRGRDPGKRKTSRDARQKATASSSWHGGTAATWGPVVVIVAAGLAAYSNSLQGAFMFDDAVSIAENKSICSLWRLDKVLMPVEKLDYYRPVLNLSLALCYGIGGLDVVPYHVFNLAVHLAAALTLFGLIRRTLLLLRQDHLLREASTTLGLVVSLLWMLHPLQTESVTYVIQRCEAMAGFFCLLSLYCVVRGATSPRAWAWYSGAVTACLLGMGSKEATAVVPWVVLLYDRIFLASSLQQVWQKRWGLYLALALTWGMLVPSVLVSRSSQPGRIADAVTSWEYARTQFGVVVHYLRLSFWPADLCLDYQWPVAQSAGEIVPPAAFLGVLLCVALGALWRRPKGGFLGAWFCLAIAPSSSVIPIRDLAFEHRMYLSLAPLAAAVVLGSYLAGWMLIQRKPSLSAAARLSSVCLVAGIAAVLGILTYLRNEDYRSELQMWQDTVAKAPNNHRAHNNLGRALVHEGRLAEALVHYDKALEINPDYAQTNFNLGLLLVQLGHVVEAIPRLQQSLKINPNDIETHLNLGVAFARLDRNEEAIGHYRKALAIDSQYAPAHNNLGNLLLRQGRVDEAVACYQAAVEIDPRDPEYQHNLGVGLRQLGSTD